MKNLLLVVILTSIFGAAMAQDDIYFRPENKSKFSTEIKQLKPDEKDQYQIDFVRHCLKKYHDEKILGYGLQVTGVLLAGVGLNMSQNDNTEYDYQAENTENKEGKGLIYVGAAFSIAGIITLIDSEKWMKRAYIGPDGLGVRFTF